MSIRTYNVSVPPRTPGVYSVLVNIHGVKHPRSSEHPEIFAYWDGVDKWSCGETSEYQALRAKMCGPQVRYPWKEIAK